MLIAVTGVAAIAVLDRMHRGGVALRARVAERSGRLERIRRAIYLSSTLARDSFVEPDGPGAEALRVRLVQSEADAGREFANYSEAARLRSEVYAYWKLLDLMADMARKRHTPGVDAYFRQQLAQRREAMLQIADNIGAALVREAQQGETDLSALYRRFRSVFALELALLLVFGLAVATATARRLLRLESETRGLSAQLLRTQEEERRAIARELHDEVAQWLSGLLLDVGGAASLASAESTGLRARLQAIAATAERTVDSVRRIALSLRPSMLDDLGLVPALEWQARETGNRTGLNVQVIAEESAGDLPEAHRTCIYRVAQEALRNCARHAGARKVRVELTRGAQAVTLRVVDDGKGFPVSRTRGLGLLGMQERVEQLGGRFRAHAEPGRGATVLAELPL